MDLLEEQDYHNKRLQQLQTIIPNEFRRINEKYGLKNKTTIGGFSNFLAENDILCAEMSYNFDKIVAWDAKKGRYGQWIFKSFEEYEDKLKELLTL